MFDTTVQGGSSCWRRFENQQLMLIVITCHSAEALDSPCYRLLWHSIPVGGLTLFESSKILLSMHDGVQVQDLDDGPRGVDRAPLLSEFQYTCKPRDLGLSDIDGMDLRRQKRGRPALMSNLPF